MYLKGGADNSWSVSVGIYLYLFKLTTLSDPDILLTSPYLTSSRNLGLMRFHQVLESGKSPTDSEATNVRTSETVRSIGRLRRRAPSRTARFSLQVMAHPFDDMQDLHLKTRIAGHTAEGTEKAMFFRTERVVIG